MSDSGADAKATSLRWYHEAQPQLSQPPTFQNSKYISEEP